MSDFRIRTVTGFINSNDLEKGERLMDASKMFEANGIEVRTRRIAFEHRHWDKESVTEISATLQAMGIWGFSTTYYNPQDSSQMESARSVIEFSDNGFVNFQLAGNDVSFDSNSIAPVVDFIHEVGEEGIGIGNFRVGVSFGVDNPTPFFPYSAYQNGDSFAVGLEYINIVMNIIEQFSRSSLSVIKEKILETLSLKCLEIVELCRRIEEESGVEFLGIDISMAPYPYPLEEQSVVDIIEELGRIARSRGDPEFKFGRSGSLFLHTFITNILKTLKASPDIPTTGFNGVMYSVLEDTRLSQRYASGTCGVSDLLLTSTTCGCGIDMLPMVSMGAKKAIGSMMMDIYALSCTLEKPLGMRVLPIPDSRSGDWTRFKHLFFTNTVVRDHGSGISIHQLPAQKDDSQIKF